nr:hypothetical protein [uncultured Pedobacter sp.]
MHTVIKKNLLIISSIVILFLCYHQFYFKKALIGNFYSTQDNALIFRFYQDGAGYFVQIKDDVSLAHKFQWKQSPERDYKMLRFAGIDLKPYPTTVSGKPITWEVLTSNGCGVKKEAEKFKRFPDDYVFAVLDSEDETEPAFTMFATKKSLFLDIKNSLEHGY